MRRKDYAPHYVPADPTLELVSTLDNMGGKTPLECLALFRNLMLDVCVSTSYGYRLGAVHTWL
ncbi:hypothetical protein BDZ89DRAFT_1130372 [Hymenopellis radicata]|nr:hypothetical protein BDZ89DRAFT_1130372 [Hymenopellis radicata]